MVLKLYVQRYFKEIMMKKIFIMTAIFMLLAAGSAFADTLELADNTVGGSTGGKELTGETAAGNGEQAISRMSTNVVITAQYNPFGYIINTYHTTGNKAYSSGYDSTALYWKNVGDSADLEVPSTSVSDDYYTSGWNKM